MLQKGSDSDDSNSKNAFEQIWQLIGPALITILPILMRLAFARIGNKTQANLNARSDTGPAATDEPQLTKNASDQSQQTPRELTPERQQPTSDVC